MAEQNQNLEITVQTTDRKTVKVLISENATINDLKKAIQQAKDLPTSDMIILYSGKQFSDDSATLKTCGFKTGITVVIVIKKIKQPEVKQPEVKQPVVQPILAPVSPLRTPPISDTESEGDNDPESEYNQYDDINGHVDPFLQGTLNMFDEIPNMGQMHGPPMPEYIAQLLASIPTLEELQGRQQNAPLMPRAFRLPIRPTLPTLPPLTQNQMDDIREIQAVCGKSPMEVRSIYVACEHNKEAALNFILDDMANNPQQNFPDFF